MKFDRQRLQQVMLNLVKNAIKFSHIGGDITIFAEVIAKPSSEDRMQQLFVSVQDRGIGVQRSE